MWKVHDKRIRSAAESSAVKELHEILERTFGKGGNKLPHSLRQANPFILSRDFGKSPSSHSNDNPNELYRFQLGPRAWSKPVYVYDGHKVDERYPRYEQDAEELAKQLKLAEWERVASPLIEPFTAEFPSANEICKTQLTLCWQDNERYCIVYDRRMSKAIAFLWTDVGLSLLGEAHPQRLIQFEMRSTYDAYEMPVISVDEGAVGFKSAQRAGQMDEFVAATHWRYGTRLDGKLDSLLFEACERLAMIEGDVGLAFAGHRFNDASGDDSWLAVRLGNFAWENGSYFSQNASTLRSAPCEVHGLLGLLVHLKSSGIGSAFNQCYGYPVEALDVMGLFRQGGHYYFACCNSQGDCGPVYEVSLETGQTKLYGFTDRFDWNFNNGDRAGGCIPKANILEIVTLNEVVRRVEIGETHYEAGPPHGMDVAWMAYIPSDPDETNDLSV
jgi:hypothetical protein